MKGVQGLVIAVALAIVGALCNWFYITQQASQFETESFVLIGDDVQINPGDRFKKSDFERVEMPSRHMGNLDQVAVLWRDLNTVIGEVATKPYGGGELLLQDDLRTPPQRDISELLGAEEVLRWVPVDQRMFAADHVNPGNLVRFVVPVGAGLAIEPSGSDPDGTRTDLEGDGPFEILTMGNRRGRKEVLRARGNPVGQENLIGIRVPRAGPVAEEARRLFDAIRLTGNKGVEVVVLSSKVKPAN